MSNSEITCHRGTPRMEVGRIRMTFPCYGRLATYVKHNGHPGATFQCEDDGGRFGVASTVLNRFSDPATRHGWGYVDEESAVVFRFMPEDQTDKPQELMAITTRQGRVDLPASARRIGTDFADGAVVGFYAQSKPAGRGRLKRVATDVFQVDREHFGVVARLVSTGSLLFPDHSEVLETFFSELSTASQQSARNRVLVRSALKRIVSDPSVPARYRTLARVERSKDLVEGASRGSSPVRRDQVNDRRAKMGVNTGRSTVSDSLRNGVVTDIVRLDLHLEED